MFGWSSPFKTSISPHTLSSFPLTFFFGMIFNATSFVMPLGDRSPGFGEGGLEVPFFVDKPASSSATAPLSAVLT
jgi:hypothetical protein